MAQRKIPTSKAPLDRVPSGRGRGVPSTMTPRRMGGIVAALLSGDTVKAACASMAVAKPTYDTWRQLGERALNEARHFTGEDDMEGAVWAWLEDLGGPQNGSPSANYWTEEAPDWWPSDLHKRWTNAVFVILIYWARGQSERVYRQTITQAAKEGDWKAAEFMLTHSFGWQRADRLELSGPNGAPIEVQGDEDRALSALAMLAERQKEIDIVDAEEVTEDEER